MSNLQKQLQRFFERERYDKIISLIESLSEKEQTWDVMEHYIRALSNDWKHERAIEVSMQFQEQGLNNPYWHYRLGYSYFRLDNKKKAKQFLLQAKELADSDEILISRIDDVWNALHGKPIKQEPKTKYIMVDEELIDEMDEHDVGYIIYPLWFGVNIYESGDVYEDCLKTFSIPQRYVFAMQWYSAEVNNGGHDQFYWNSTGIVWEDALKGFEAIKAFAIVDILKESAKRMGGSPSKNRNERQDYLDKHQVVFDDLDDLYYDNQADMMELLILYIKENAKKFIYSGEIQIG